VGTKDAGLAIVENRDTGKVDTEIRRLTDEEGRRMLGQPPEWLNGR